MYKKANPDISFKEFYILAKDVEKFKSLNGKPYQVLNINNNKMTFIREATDEIWKMDLDGVYTAYIELSDFKTANFKPYVPRTHSPALGLLLHLGLLKRI